MSAKRNGLGVLGNENGAPAGPGPVPCACAGLAIARAVLAGTYEGVGGLTGVRAGAPRDPTPRNPPPWVDPPPKKGSSVSDAIMVAQERCRPVGEVGVEDRGWLGGVNYWLGYFYFKGN